MPTRQKHRGANPRDAELFSNKYFERLGSAVQDLYFLRSKGYGDSASLKVVGDRYRLVKRQRYALERIVTTRDEIQSARKRQVALDTLQGKEILIDGFNVLIFVEVICSGGFVFECLDGTFRDIASVHGSYNKVQETEASIDLIGRTLTRFQPESVTWLLDKPVSNSGRLKKLLLSIAYDRGWNWQAAVVANPDDQLMNHESAVILSSDRQVIGNCHAWFNITSHIATEGTSDHFRLITLSDLSINFVNNEVRTDL